MQLHYNIIWIDDEIDEFQKVGDIDRVYEYLKELGFTPDILPLKEGKEIQKYFEKQKYDLILSDFSIEEGHHGDDIIKAIRRSDIFTEVLFYTSQQNELENIAKRLLTVDRISFHSGRRGLVDKIENLIYLSVAKLLELNATRGLITAETSELDVIIETVVMNLVFDKLKLKPEDVDKIIHFYVDDFLKKSPERFLNKYNQLGFKNWFHRVEANRKWSIFRELLKELLKSNPTDEVNKFLELNSTYGKEVIDIRNKFAHAKAVLKDDKLYLEGLGIEGEKFAFDEVECISIRKRLINHRENFHSLLNHLQI